ncbi:MAG: nuclear transport factor 2 family protein [Pyrinomonadaceae bacterium]
MNNNDDLKKKVGQIEDRIALKELVDTFSILADKKDVKTQTQLFTADGIVETFVNGARVANLKGRKAMEEAFGAFLKNFETVYHFNGQQTVTIDGDKASGISYCMVTLIGTENGKKMKTSIGVYYQDEYVRENGRWLIAKRTSTFDWQDKRELGQ